MAVSQELRKLVQAIAVSCLLIKVFFITSLSLEMIEEGWKLAVILDTYVTCDVSDALYPYLKTFNCQLPHEIIDRINNGDVIILAIYLATFAKSSNRKNMKRDSFLKKTDNFRKYPKTIKRQSPPVDRKGRWHLSICQKVKLGEVRMDGLDTHAPPHFALWVKANPKSWNIGPPKVVMFPVCAI